MSRGRWRAKERATEIVPLRGDAARHCRLFQIGREDRHLEIVAALIVLVVDEQHADELLADIDLGGIVLFRTRHDTQPGVAEQLSHIIFQLADFLDVHGSSFAPWHPGALRIRCVTAILARHAIQIESRGIPVALPWRVTHRVGLSGRPTLPQAGEGRWGRSRVTRRCYGASGPWCGMAPRSQPRR